METPIEHIHKDLIDRCKTGDQRAQKALYELYADAMFNVCMRMLNNKYEDAEDMLQESFINAFRKIDQFRFASTFGAWLKKIVVYGCINHLKKKRIPISSFEGVEYKVAEMSSQTAPSEGWKTEHILKGIEQLAPGYRTVLNLYLLEGYDHEEISSILGISVSTSKTQLKRGKQKLVEIVKDKVWMN